MEQLLEWDQSLFLFINRLGNNEWDYYWKIITNKRTWTPLYLILVSHFFYKYSWKKALVLTLIAILGVGLSDQVTNLFKYGVARLRPCHQDLLIESMRMVKKSCGGKFGFYSAHASNHMFLAVYLSLIIRERWVSTSLVIWALFIGYSRIYLGVHFPSDVFVGFIMGSFWAALMYKLYTFYLNKLTL